MLFLIYIALSKKQDQKWQKMEVHLIIEKLFTWITQDCLQHLLIYFMLLKMSGKGMKVSLVGVLNGTVDQTLLIISIIVLRNLPVNIQVCYCVSIAY